MRSICDNYTTAQLNNWKSLATLFKSDRSELIKCGFRSELTPKGQKMYDIHQLSPELKKEHSIFTAKKPCLKRTFKIKNSAGELTLHKEFYLANRHTNVLLLAVKVNQGVPFFLKFKYSEKGTKTNLTLENDMFKWCKSLPDNFRSADSGYEPIHARDIVAILKEGLPIAESAQENAAVLKILNLMLEILELYRL
jgi:hypothetical protein